MVKSERLAGTPASGRQIVFIAVVTIALVAMTARPTTVSAAETDQFLVWGVELDDGSEQLNQFINQEFERALARINRGDRQRPCSAVPGRLYRRAFSSLLSSRLRRFIETSEIEWYPRRDVSNWEYRSQSVFRRSVFSFFLPMARTMRVGDVYLGVDKLAHMFGIGRRYYIHYRGQRRKLSAEEAQRKTVVWGLKMERFFLGGYAEGIISHADLEANFQGLRLAMDMCEGDDPYLIPGEDGWRFSRPIDLRDYVNPAFDESYNTNHYFRFQWRVVQPILQEKYCPRYGNEEVQRRLARYRRIDTGSLSREVIAQHYEKSGHKSPRLFAVDHLCTGPGERSAQSTERETRPRGSG